MNSCIIHLNKSVEMQPISLDRKSICGESRNSNFSVCATVNSAPSDFGKSLGLDMKTLKGILQSTIEKGMKDSSSLYLTLTILVFLIEEGLVSSNNYGLRFVYSNDCFIKKEDVFFICFFPSNLATKAINEFFSHLKHQFRTSFGGNNLTEIHVKFRVTCRKI